MGVRAVPEGEWARAASEGGERGRGCEGGGARAASEGGGGQACGTRKNFSTNTVNHSNCGVIEISAPRGSPRSA